MRFKLLEVSGDMGRKFSVRDYPVEPQPVDRSIILGVGSDWNLSIFLALSSSDWLPSMWTNSML